MSEVMIETKEVRKAYRMGDVEVRALDGVSLSVRRGEFVSIMGPSGSGKSTLLNLIGCLDRPTSGAIEISGKDVTTLTERELDSVRLRRIGFIFQRANLVPILSAVENVELPMEIAGVPGRARRERAIALLESVGLAGRLHHRPAQMSAGEQQRVGIARAIANRPDVLLADEPTGNLDSKISSDIVGLLERLHRESNLTIVLVTHDSEVAERAQRVINIRDGRCEKTVRGA
ncbi:MAG: ABC transporter ATP-binding protein [bacterium]